MRFEPLDFVTESDSVKDVDNFVVLETDEEDGYHIAEKWLSTDGNEKEDDEWVHYWVSEQEMHNRADKGLIEKAGTVSEEQHEAVCERAGAEVERESEKVAA